MLIKDLIQTSPAELITVRPDTFVREAAQLMTKNRIGLLVVLGYSDELVGVLSERDIVGAMSDSNADIDHLSVSELMNISVVTIEPQESLVDAISAMNLHGIRHLVAIGENRPVAIISIRDVLRAFAEEVMKNGRVVDTPANRAFVSALAAYQRASQLSIQI